LGLRDMTLRDVWTWLFVRTCRKCGPDVTEGLRASKQQVEANFRLGMDLDVRHTFWDDNCRPYSSLTASPYQAERGWDLDSLVSVPDGPRIRTPDGVSKCPFGRGCVDSVTVDGKCYWKWAVNYAMYGWMNRLCGFSKAHMRRTIKWHRGFKSGNSPSEIPENSKMLEFAEAGYDGFPGAGTVAADSRYRDCMPCEDAYSRAGLAPRWPRYETPESD